MAKKKRAEAACTLDDFAAAARLALHGNASKKSAAATDSFITGGIRMPLIMQYLFDIRAWPLGILIQITGDKGTRKSSLVFEISRWFANRMGMADYTVTEGKLSETLLYSLLGYPDEWEQSHDIPYPLRWRVSGNMKEWQVAVTESMSVFNKMMDEGWDDNGTKRVGSMYVPILYAIDSIVAQLTEKQVEVIESQGGSDRGYATHVKAISQWISTVQAKMTNRPYSLVLINHCTITRPTEFLTEITPKGGSKLAYESSFVMYLERTGMDIIHCKKEGYAPEANLTAVKAKLLKTSLGNETRKIKFYILDENQYSGEGNNTQPRQRTTYLWGRALVELLMSRMYSDPKYGMSISDASAGLRNAIRDRIKSAVDFKALDGTDRYMCSKYSDEELSGEELGQYMENDPQFVQAFYDTFAIKVYDTWPIGMDYKTFSDSLKEKTFAERISIPAYAEGELDG